MRQSTTQQKHKRNVGHIVSNLKRIVLSDESVNFTKSWRAMATVEW